MQMPKLLRSILFVIFAAVFLVSGYLLVDYYLESRQQAQSYDQLAQMVGTAPQRPAPTRPLDESLPEEETTALPQQPVLTDVLNKKTGQTVSVLSQYASLFELNPDMVGWLQIPGTQANYPVMQTPEDPEYYLHRDFYEENSKHGCLFTAPEPDVQAPSDNVTIYGHHMRDGSMFADLMKYKDQSFWQTHKYIYFDSLSQMHTYEILAVFLTTASSGKGFAFHRFVDAQDSAAFDSYISSCKALSLYDTGVDAVYGDKLITLSTCEYTQTNGRLVVVAKQVS